MIGIVGYGLGNVLAIRNIYERLGVPAEIIIDSSGFDRSKGLILPGVGAFDWAMKTLDSSGLRGPLTDAVCDRNTPVLGICVGMQMLASSSEEGKSRGLEWIDGEVRSLRGLSSEVPTRLPHMGWNDIEARNEHELLTELIDRPRFYFLHSYYFDAARQDDVMAVTNYGERFPCAVRKGNVMGVQFHPEKSHGWGIQLLKNFAGLSGC